MLHRVEVTEGILQGEQRTSCDGKKYYSFEGVPYAKPPIGKLRFRDPQELESWEGVRDATKPGNICAQMNPYQRKPLEGSEDCLYLNVYTPNLPDEQNNKKLPVLFFVHGGRFLFGYSHYYQPDYFIRHDVILVTINYRLHILGFFCLNTPEVPGNAAMKDTVMALKWVKKNIGFFNGDSNNVTAFGESAGGGIVSSYLTSKMTDGLFNKVIAQSGNCVNDLLMNEDDPFEKGRRVAAILGKDCKDTKSLYEFLMNAPIEDLVPAVAKAEVDRQPGVVNAYFTPVVEKIMDGVECYFQEHPSVSMRENRFKKLPILNGLCSHEGAFFITKNKKGEINFVRNLEMYIPRYMFIKRNTPEAKKIARRFHEYYFKGREINEKMLLQYVEFLSDAYFSRDVMMFQEYCSRNNENVYLYNFAYHGSINTSIIKKLGIKGASHGDIMQYQFYKKNKIDKCNEKDIEIINFLSETWCNFATFGRPTWSNQNTEWLPYKVDQKCCLIIDDNIRLDKKMEWNRYEFWKKIVEEKCKI